VNIDGVPYIRLCVQGEGTGWESVLPASLSSSGPSGWCEGKCRGIRCNGSPTKKTKHNKPIKKIKMSK